MLVGVLLIIFIGAGGLYLFQSVQIPLVKVEGASAPPVLIAELILIAASFVLYFILVEYRMLALISLVTGQMSLLFFDTPVFVLGKEIPIYGLMGVNGFVFLMFYFAFSKHLWAPERIDPEEYDRRG